MVKKVNLQFDLDIPCQKCGKKFKVSTKDVGKSVKCPHCRTITQLKDNGFTKGLQKANNALNKLFKI